MNYAIHYVANDNTRRFFMMTSNRRLVSGSRINLNSNPLLREVFAQIHKRDNDPESSMSNHGGFKRLLRIENVDTKTVYKYSI